MKGETYLKKPEDFTRIHQQGSYLGNRLISLKSLPNNFNYSRWAIITSKKIGKAVVRNRVKRRLREILRQACLEPGKDIIIIARIGSVLADFSSLREDTLSLLKKAGLVKNNETNCPVVNKSIPANDIAGNAF